jgi:PPM family protein phosphatase
MVRAQAGFMDDLMPIGEFSERSGLSPKRLRTYAAAGLLMPAAVDPESGYRYYAPGQLGEARAIDALRRADVPLVDIGDLLRDPSPEKLDEWTQQVDLDKDERHEALRQARHLLEIGEGPTTASQVQDARKERPMEFTATARTDTGRVRERNEDRALCVASLIAVADGMGGAPGGETASSLAIAVIEAAFSGGSLDELEAAARAVNAAVFERASADEQLDGMGTTLCAVGLTDDGHLAVINVGDSRAYLLRNDSLQRLTTDHTLVAELVRQGELAEDDIADHPQRGVLLRAVGVSPTIEVDGALHPAHPGDRLLVCSDGLSNEIGEDLILSTMSAEQDLSTSASALVDYALANGGRDNVTVVIAEISS